MFRQKSIAWMKRRTEKGSHHAVDRPGELNFLAENSNLSGHISCLPLLCISRLKWIGFLLGQEYVPKLFRPFHPRRPELDS